MSNLNSLLLTVAVAGTLGLAFTASAQSLLSEKDGIAASPKVRQMFARGKAVSDPTAATVSSSSVGYQATREDGITASPKLREQLNQRGASFRIAPIK